MAKLDTIEGLSLNFIQMLHDASVASVEQLLDLGKTREGMLTLSQKTNIRRREIEKWVGQAGLSRINGIGSEYAALLVAVGVRTVKNLSTTDPEALHAKLVRYKRTHRKIRRVPAVTIVEEWIEKANQLRPIADF